MRGEETAVKVGRYEITTRLGGEARGRTMEEKRMDMRVRHTYARITLTLGGRLANGN